MRTLLHRKRRHLAVAALTAIVSAMTPARAVTLPAMTVTITQPPAALSVGQTAHSAFPGLARRPDGSIRLVWRQGTDHAASRDGKIMSAISLDDGATFGPESTLRAGKDYRDPSISVVDGVERLTWFTGDATNPALGAETMTEWGPSVRFDGGLPRAATTAPLVTLPDGRIGGTFYGRKVGDTIDTCWMAWSSDGGLTWTTNRMTNLIGSGVHTNEPFITVDEELTHLFYRWGTADAIGLRSLPNSGASGTSTQRRILENASGRPTVIRSSATGALVMVYRRLPDKAAQMAVSLDRGLTWADAGTLLPSGGGGIGMTYAAMVETAPGVIFGVVGMETTSTSSTLHGFRLTA